VRGSQVLYGDNDNMQRGGGGWDRKVPYNGRDGVTGFKGLSRGYHVTATKMPYEELGRGQRSDSCGSGQ